MDGLREGGRSISSDGNQCTARVLAYASGVSAPCSDLQDLVEPWRRSDNEYNVSKRTLYRRYVLVKF